MPLKGISSKYPFFGVNPELSGNLPALVLERQKQKKGGVMTFKVSNILQIVKLISICLHTSMTIFNLKC